MNTASRPVRTLKPRSYDAVVMAVAPPGVPPRSASRRSAATASADHVLYDIKYVFKGSEVDGRL